MKEYGQYIPCPKNNEACKYYPECNPNTIHHKIPRRLLKQLTASIAIGEAEPGLYPIAKKYINNRKNQIRCCRLIHDLLDTMTPDELPDRETMEDFNQANLD